jgi:hypothetical protein
MFLCSEVCIQASEIYLSFDKATAAFAGAAASGYITGFVAAPREWVKVLRTQERALGQASSMRGALIESIKIGTWTSAFKRSIIHLNNNSWIHLMTFTI